MTPQWKSTEDTSPMSDTNKGKGISADASVDSTQWKNTADTSPLADANKGNVTVPRGPGMHTGVLWGLPDAVGNFFGGVGAGAISTIKNFALPDPTFKKQADGSYTPDGDLNAEHKQKMEMLSAPPAGVMGTLGNWAERGVEAAMIPGSTGTRGVKMASDAAKNAALTLAQTDDPKQALVSGSIAAAIPGIGAVVEKAAPQLKRLAEKIYASAVIPSGGPAANKLTVQKAVPELLDMGFTAWTRGGLKDKVADAVSLGESQIAHAENQIHGQMVNMVPTINALQDELQSHIKNGMVMPGYETIAGQLQKNIDYIKNISLGTHYMLPAEQVIDLRRGWDAVVDYKKLDPGAAMLNMAFRRSANAVRSTLSDLFPAYKAANQEYSFWRGIQDVGYNVDLKEVGHSGGMSHRVAQTVGAGLGYSHGSSESPTINLVTGYLAMGGIDSLLRSTGFRTMSGKALHDIGDSLSSGDYTKALQYISRYARSPGADDAKLDLSGAKGTPATPPIPARYMPPALR